MAQPVRARRRDRRRRPHRARGPARPHRRDPGASDGGRALRAGLPDPPSRDAPGRARACTWSPTGAGSRSGGADASRRDCAALERWLDDAIDAGVDADSDPRARPRCRGRSAPASRRGRRRARAGRSTPMLVNDRADVALRSRRRRRAPARRRAARATACARSAPPAGSSGDRSIGRRRRAGDGGADYLLFGTVFPSASKPAGAPVAGLDGAPAAAAAARDAGAGDRRDRRRTRARGVCRRRAPPASRPSACSCPPGRSGPARWGPARAVRDASGRDATTAATSTGRVPPSVMIGSRRHGSSARAKQRGVSLREIAAATKIAVARSRRSSATTSRGCRAASSAARSSAPTRGGRSRSRSDRRTSSSSR